MMEKIVARKMQIYKNMQQKLTVFKKHLQEEEEASHRMTNAPFII